MEPKFDAPAEKSDKSENPGEGPKKTDAPGLFRATKAAKDVGYSREERRALLTQPKKFAEERISKKLAAALTPETIAGLFARLEGVPAETSADLLRLGNVLFEFQKWLKGKGYEELKMEEIRLLSFVDTLLEHAVHQGTLLRLSGRDRAEMAFFVNRLAKLKELPDTTREVSSFDRKKFGDLAADVEAYAREDFSEQHLDRMVQEREGEMSLLEERLLTSEEAVVRHGMESEVYLRGMDKTMAIFASERRAAFQDIARRLERLVTVYTENFGPLAEDDAESVRGAIALLRSLTEAQAQEALSRPSRIYDSRDYHGPWYLYEDIVFFLKEYRQDKKLGSDGLPSVGSGSVNACIQDMVQKLRAKRASVETKGGQAKGARIKSFQALGETSKLEKISDELLVVAQEFPPHFSKYSRDASEVFKENNGIMAARARLLGSRMEAMISADRLRDAMDAAPSHPLRAEYKKWKDFLRQVDVLRQAKGNLKDLWRQFLASKDVILRDMAATPSSDLYFVKALLVASDLKERRVNGVDKYNLSNRGPEDYIYSRSPQPWNTPVKAGGDGRIVTHEFLQRMRAKKENGSSSDDEYESYFSDIHYRADYLPFALMMADFFEAKSKEDLASSEQEA